MYVMDDLFISVRSGHLDSHLPSVEDHERRHAVHGAVASGRLLLQLRGRIATCFTVDTPGLARTRLLPRSLGGERRVGRHVEAAAATRPADSDDSGAIAANGTSSHPVRRGCRCRFAEQGNRFPRRSDSTDEDLSGNDARTHSVDHRRQAEQKGHLPSVPRHARGHGNRPGHHVRRKSAEHARRSQLLAPQSASRSLRAALQPVHGGNGEE